MSFFYSPLCVCVCAYFCTYISNKNRAADKMIFFFNKKIMDFFFALLFYVYINSNMLRVFIRRSLSEIFLISTHIKHVFLQN